MNSVPKREFRVFALASGEDLDRIAGLEIALATDVERIFPTRNIPRNRVTEINLSTLR